METKEFFQFEIIITCLVSSFRLIWIPVLWVYTVNLNILSVYGRHINPFRPEFTIVIFIHYKPRIAVAILDL